MLDLPSFSREYPPRVAALRRSCTLRAAPTFVFAVDCGFGKPKWCRSHATGHQRDLGGSMDELFTRLCRRVTVCRPVRLQGQAALLMRTRRKRSLRRVFTWNLPAAAYEFLFDALLLGLRADNCSSIECSFYNVVLKRLLRSCYKFRDIKSYGNILKYYT